MQEVDALAEWVGAFVALEGPLVPLPAEASTRHFFRARISERRRVRNEGRDGTASWIAMHAPPATEDNARFLRLARLFRCHGLATPEIHAFDADRGFVLMEDLGATDFASAYETHDVDHLMNAAMDTLAVLQDVPPDGIPPYETERFSDELDIFSEWLIERFLGLSVPGDFAVTRQALIAATQTVPTCVVHRDYHCRNLIWRDDGTVGIVDFQDALNGPACYDIASLLRDCYVEFAEKDVLRWRRRFLRVAQPECADAVFEHAFDLTAMQRQLKAVGIFARLYLSRRRRSHLGDIVPVLRRIAVLATTYPETTSLAGWLDAEVVPAAERRLGSVT